MREAEIMDRSDLRLLQGIRQNPCLTITLPTHRTSPDNKQDPIRVKNLVTEATNRLRGEFPQREIEVLLKRLDQLVDDIDYRYTLDGMALFVNHDSARRFDLPFSLDERVVVDDTFFTRDLVYAFNRTPRYWVLSLSEQPTRLYHAVRDDLEEVSATGFPMTHTGPGGEERLPGGLGINTSGYRDDAHRQFFRDVDKGLTKVLAADPLPFALVGVDRYIAFFNEVSSNTSDIIATLTGNYDHMSAHDVGKLVWPIAKEGFAERRLKVLDELDAAIGGQRCSSTLGEVWRMANEGRGSVLLVEEGYHEAAHVGENGMLEPPRENQDGPEDLDDAVDEVITTVLEKGGRVVFVDDGTLAQHSRIALILRY